ncbi:serine-rich adhesin for platelets-like isoform X2 [Palaemon carinicauda]|uniref:serine-rich adhesin for platelets-like isoform X2 n=1 Tax=Palaemon carinicauda TaxID=392227 RepID=UPI0035B61F1C
MALARTLAGIQGIFAIFILFPSRSLGQDEPACVDHFTCDPEAFGAAKFVELKNIVITEDAGVGTQLFTCQWDEANATASLPSGALFDKYFLVESTEPSTWNCRLKAPLAGVPDYPDVNSTVTADTVFSGFSNLSECNFVVTITVSDVNSQNPEFIKGSYALEIAEDWPVNVAVQTDIQIRDQDKDSPNNIVDVSVDAGCPISPEPSQYTDFGGSFEDVNFILRTSLDFETKASYDCTITLKDEGNPVRSSTAVLAIKIQDKPDEPPAFDSPFYTAEVTDPVPAEGGSQLETSPRDIHAEDGDKGQPSTITYTMKDFDETIPGTTYFEIEPSTGIVTHIQTIGDDILEKEQLIFILTATDESMAEGTSILLVNLPPIPTTTPEPTTTTPQPTTTTTPEPSTASTTVMTESSTESSSSTDESSSSPSETTTSVTTESTISPSMTYSTTSSMTYSTTTPVVTESTTSPGMTESTTSPVVTESTTSPSMSVSTTSPSMTYSTTSPSMSVSTTSPSVTESTSSSTSTPGPEPSIKFTKEAYGASVPERFGGPFLTLDVLVEEIDREEVQFSLEGDDSIYFEINSPAAEIYLKGDGDAPSGQYSFTARAKADTSEGTPLNATSQINVIVLTASSSSLSLTESLHRPKLDENKKEETLFSITLEDTGAIVESYCIVNMNPPAYQGFFELVQGDTWDLQKVGDGIDYEETQEVSFILQVFNETVESCQNKSTTQSLFRNEALVIVSINNLNDEPPVFKVPASESETIFYPKDVALQKVVGPVITLKADDADLQDGKLEESIIYSITSESAGFSIEDTGSIYVNGEFSCEGDGCKIKVGASDGKWSAKESTITVKSLDMSSIFTLTMDDTEVGQVDDELGKLSDEIGLQISKVYVNPEIQVSTEVQESSPMHSSHRSYARYQRYKSSSNSGEHWQIEVNLYATDGDSLISLPDFNKKLTDSGHNAADPFADEAIFNPPTGSDTGLIAAVCVLAILLAWILLGGGFLMFRRHRSKKKTPSKSISTVGGAYPNRGFSDDEDETKTSEDSDQNEDVERISLSRYPSALAVNTDSSTAGENKQEGKVGLRRTDPGTPEYYGISSPEPPPSYSKDDSTAKNPEAVASSSINNTEEPRQATTYLTKNPKKTPPPLNVAPAKSILRGKGGSDAKQDIPPYRSILQQKDPSKPSVPDVDYKSEDEADDDTVVSSFPGLKGSPTLKKKFNPEGEGHLKPSVPDVDYKSEDEADDDTVVSSFPGLKGSPTLKKKSNPEGEGHLKPEEDDYGDNHSGKVNLSREVKELTREMKELANPDEKKSNLKKDDLNSEREDEVKQEAEEEKSVAFKVLVDMKVIETENPGRGQKEAAAQAAKDDAIELIEANTKKLEASSAGDDEEDEEEMLSSL